MFERFKKNKKDKELLDLVVHSESYMPAPEGEFLCCRMVSENTEKRIFEWDICERKDNQWRKGCKIIMNLFAPLFWAELPEAPNPKTNWFNEKNPEEEGYYICWTKENGYNIWFYEGEGIFVARKNSYQTVKPTFWHKVPFEIL